MNMNLVEALDKFISEILIMYAERGDWPTFNSNLLLTKEVDKAIKSQLKGLQKTFKSYSGAENTPNETKGVSFREWMTL
eukprot:gene9194-19059_t